MKKRLLIIAMAFMMVFMAGCSSKSENSKSDETLTIFSLSEYIDLEVIEMFEEETGITVKLEEAVTPEEMYSKYSTGAIKYDMLCTTDFMVDRLISENELQEVDFSSMENVKNIGAKFFDMTKMFDTENKYALPYFWGTLGILYNKNMVSEPIDSWDALFSGEYKGKIIMQNSMRDIYMVALKALGYSVNTTNKDELKEAHELLMKQKPDVQAYLVDEARDEMVAENAALAVIYSGEAYLGHEYNENLEYVVPKEGSNVWVDSWVVTKNCENVENAEKFMDFLCREDIAAMNFEYIYYSTPNEAVVDAMDDELKNNKTIVPADEDTKNCEVSRNLDKETLEIYNDMWKNLKAE